jgi:hypothetical protein
MCVYTVYKDLAAITEFENEDLDSFTRTSRSLMESLNIYIQHTPYQQVDN